MKPTFDINKIKHKFNFDIRSATSYSARDLIKYYNSNIDFDIMLSNGQPLQRPFVWTLEQKRSLILSMLKELAIPEFLVVVYRDYSQINQSKDILFKIIDGKQRLSTILSFINNEFPILIEGFGYFYGDLDATSQRLVWGRSLDFKIVYEYDNKKLTDDDYIRLFEYVNFAGTPQDINHIQNLKESLNQTTK